MNRGRIFIISGPSGVGKDTLIKEVLPRIDGAFLSVSLTTRAPRPGERDGVDYYFVTDKYFRDQVKAGNMLEYADFCTVCYGTPRPPVDEALRLGRPVILKIERDGMEQVRRIYPDAVTIFLAPPSPQILRHRLLKRNSDSEEAIERRLQRAMYEIEKSGDYMHTVINDRLEDAADELEAVIKSYL